MRRALPDEDLGIRTWTIRAVVRVLRVSSGRFLWMPKGKGGRFGVSLRNSSRGQHSGFRGPSVHVAMAPQTYKISSGLKALVTNHMISAALR